MSRRQQSNIKILKQSICHEQITVAENEIEGYYDMYRKVTAVRELGPNGLVIRVRNAQDDQCNTARQLRDIINTKDQEIDKLKEDRVLPLVVKCVHFYGSEVIVKKLQDLYPHNQIIGHFRGWSDCAAYAYQNDDGQWLQADIDQIIDTDPNIDRTIWDTLRLICHQRNKAVHGPITEDDIELLNDSVQYFQRYQTRYTTNYVPAIRTLTTALQTVPPDSFAMPGQYDLAKLL